MGQSVLLRAVARWHLRTKNLMKLALGGVMLALALFTHLVTPRPLWLDEQMWPCRGCRVENTNRGYKARPESL